MEFFLRFIQTDQVVLLLVCNNVFSQLFIKGRGRYNYIQGLEYLVRESHMETVVIYFHAKSANDFVYKFPRKLKIKNKNSACTIYIPLGVMFELK